MDTRLSAAVLKATQPRMSWSTMGKAERQPVKLLMRELVGPVDDYDAVEGKWSVRIAVHEFEDGTVVRAPSEKAHGPTVHLVQDGSRIGILTKPADEVFERLLGHACPNAQCLYAQPDCGFNTKRELDRHLEAGACLQCERCTEKFGTLAELEAHRAQQSTAPCAKKLRSQWMKALCLTSHQDSIVYADTETVGDTIGVAQIKMIGFEASEDVRKLLATVPSHALPMDRLKRVGPPGASDYEVALQHDKDANYFATRFVPCKEATQYAVEAMASEVTESFFATLELLEQLLSKRERWGERARLAASYQILTEWWYVEAGGELGGDNDDAASSSAGSSAGSRTGCSAFGDGPERELEYEDCDFEFDGPSDCESDADGDGFGDADMAHDGDSPPVESAVQAAVFEQRLKGFQKLWKKTSMEKRIKLFDRKVRPELRRLGVQLPDRCDAHRSPLLLSLETVPGHLADYIAQRRVAWERLVVRRYRGLRATMPTTIVFHNLGGFDGQPLLRHAAKTSRIHSSWRVPLGGETAVYCTNITHLNTGESCYIDIKFNDWIHFKDSFRHLTSALGQLGQDYNLPQLKTDYPHGVYATLADVMKWWTDQPLDEKPGRGYFKTKSKARGALKLKKTVLIDEADYRTVGGKDPAGTLHGPVGSKWVPFLECRRYMLNDCAVLSGVFERWREGMVRATRFDGSALEHAPLWRSTEPCVVLSIDPGPKNLGYCLIRYHGAGHAAGGTPEFELLEWGVLNDVGTSASQVQSLVQRLQAERSGFETVLVELQLLSNRQAFDQMRALQLALALTHTVHLVDSGYPKQLDGARRVFPTMSHDENKSRAVTYAETLLQQQQNVHAAAAATHPPWPTNGARDHVADAFLQAVWWCRKHCISTSASESASASESDGNAPPPLARECRACTRRWHTHGADPARYLTFAQFAAAVYRTALVHDEVVEDGKGKLSVEQRTRPRFFDENLIPTLDEAKHAAVMATAFGGRVEVFTPIFELPDMAPVCPQCDAKTAHLPGFGHACAACSRFEPKPHFPQADFEIKVVDITSQYPSVAKYDMPCGQGEWLQPSAWGETAADCAHERRSSCCTHCGARQRACHAFLLHGTEHIDFVVVNVECPSTGAATVVPFLPERKKVQFDDGTEGDGEKLIWDLRPKFKQAYDSETLRYAIGLGYTVTRIHSCLRFGRSPYCKSFMEIFQAIKEAEDAKPEEHRNRAVRQGAKNISNALPGKSGQKVRRSEKVFCSRAELEEKVTSSRLMAPPVIIDTDTFILTLAKDWRPCEAIPPLLFALVYGYSKILHYKYFLLAHSLGALVCYCDTDSWIFAFRTDRGGYQAFVDARTPDFPEGPVDQQGKYELVKDEVPGHIIEGVVATTEKRYALDLRSLETGQREHDRDGVQVPYVKIASCPLGQATREGVTNESLVGYAAQRGLVLGQTPKITVVKEGFKRRRLEVQWYATTMDVSANTENPKRKREPFEVLFSDAEAVDGLRRVEVEVRNGVLHHAGERVSGTLGRRTLCRPTLCRRTTPWGYGVVQATAIQSAWRGHVSRRSYA